MTGSSAFDNIWYLLFIRSINKILSSLISINCIKKSENFSAFYSKVMEQEIRFQSVGNLVSWSIKNSSVWASRLRSMGTNLCATTTTVPNRRMLCFALHPVAARVAAVRQWTPRLFQLVAPTKWRIVVTREFTAAEASLFNFAHEK